MDKQNDKRTNDDPQINAKGPDCDYDKRNILMVICDTDILTRPWWQP
jgi:hypothetical protein